MCYNLTDSGLTTIKLNRSVGGTGFEPARPCPNSSPQGYSVYQFRHPPTNSVSNQRSWKNLLQFFSQPIAKRAFPFRVCFRSFVNYLVKSETTPLGVLGGKDGNLIVPMNPGLELFGVWTEGHDRITITLKGERIVTSHPRGVVRRGEIEVKRTTPS